MLVLAVLVSLDEQTLLDKTSDRSPYAFMQVRRAAIHFADGPSCRDEPHRVAGRADTGDPAEVRGMT